MRTIPRLFLVLTAFLPACADCPTRFDLEGRAAIGPGDRVVIDAPNGDLRVDGVERAIEVAVTATGCGPANGVTPSIDVDTTAGERTIRVRAARANVHVLLPAGASVALRHRAGPIRVRNVVGDVWVDDTDGPIYIDGVAGTVWLRDGSGGIHARLVEGDVIVESDGSGEIDVRDVAGDFVVRAKSEDAMLIRHRDVAGAVTLPEPGRRR